MIDISSEDLLSLGEAAKLIPGRPHCTTIWRWSCRGVAGVQLESIKLGRTRYTSREALQRFAARLARADPLQQSPTPSAKKRLRQAEAELDQAGIRADNGGATTGEMG